MPFISPAAHKKFIVQCKDLINTAIADELSVQKAAQLKNDLNELEQLLQQYLHTVAQIPGLTNKYNVLQRRIRITARKLQSVKPAQQVKSRKISG